MAAITAIFTIDLVAKQLGVADVERLSTIAHDNLDPEEGRIWVHGPGDLTVIGLSDRGIEALQELVADCFPELLRT